MGNNVWLSAYGPHNWGYTAQITPEQPELVIPRGKATGGSSAVNGQVLFRGIPEDYDRWAEWGNDEWSFVNVLPYFNKLETDLDFGGGDFHGSDGPVPVRRMPRSEWLPHAQAFEQACVAEGYPIDEDQNHPESTGVSPRARNTIDGVRMSMAINYLDIARHRLNLTIRANVTARPDSIRRQKGLSTVRPKWRSTTILNYIGMSASLQLALGQGELTLQSTDPHVQPFLNYNYYQEEEDLRRMREAIRMCVRLADHPSFSSIVMERVMPTDEELSSDEELNAWLRRNSGTSHHISGTCKMGPDSDPMAVVDQHLKVKGIQGLRVADASVMPDCIRANTNATTIMIGEKVADYIKDGR
ncbi:Oxygen-dependent choline dehydrogenase [Geodia barretti]|uniref:Oxygen-dependent choline dehydrogenase n=1 Tax=Geodia barretti TaxID=519541 RepID=A0AA35RHA8_GEOBA|nr:Oxygen-dependent choline dehydrogenase [Geodia barretti]